MVLSMRSAFEPKCKFCGSRDLVRLISRVAVLRSEESRLESLADPSKWADLDESDPRSVARFMKRMGEAVGEDLGEDVEAIAEKAAREAEGGGGQDLEDGS